MSIFKPRSCALPCETIEYVTFVPTYTFSATSSVLIPEVADVTVTVTNVPRGMKLETPTYVNPLYGGSTKLSQVIPKEDLDRPWVITYVPWASTMELVTRLIPLDASSAADVFPHEINSVVVIRIPIPKYVTRLGTPLNKVIIQAWPISTKTTCATFGWGLTSGDAKKLLDSFLYTVVDAQGIVWAENILPASSSEVAVNDLKPGTEYVFTIRGLYVTPNSTASTTVSNAAVSVTSLPYLGQNFTLSESSVYDSVANTWTLTVTYSDYRCISNIIAVANSSGTAAVVTRIGTTLPLVFSVSGVPPSSSLYVSLDALADPACICGSVGATVISGLLLLDTAPTPNVCADVQPVTNLQANKIGASCLQVSWTPSSTASYGYRCSLTNADYNEVIQIHDSKVNTVSFFNLTPATTYGVTVAVFCDDHGDTGADASIQVTTVAACTPFLGPVVPADVVITLAQNSTYTAVVSYSNFLCTNPVLGWATGTAIPTLGLIVPPQSLTVPQWTVTGLPAGGSFGMVFTGTPIHIGADCTASCCISTSIVPVPATFSLTTPTNTCGVVSNVECTANQTLSSLTFSWQWSGTSSSAQFQYYYSGSPVVTIIPTSTKSVTLTGLASNTEYTFYVRVICGATVAGSYASGTGTTLTPPPAASLPPFSQTDSNPTFTSTSAEDYVMTLTYTSSATGIDPTSLNLVSDADPPLSIVKKSSIVFTAVVNTTASPYFFHMSANKISGGIITSTSFPIDVPSTPPTPAEKLFDLIIPNYAGPPKVFSTICQDVTGDTQEELYAVLEATGGTAPSQSYEQLSNMFEVYADMIVERFIKYRMQTPQAVLGYTGLHTPISRIYFGNVSDPTLQNAITPVWTKHKDYSDWGASFSYNTALTAYPPPVPNPSSFAVPSPSLILSSFAVPPFLVFYAKMMVYNWEMLSNKYTNNSPVQLGATMYGSNKPDECWWFNAQVNTDGTITTITPTNPMQQPSVIDGTANDGNGPSDSDYQLAGWNCMERWFMHIAYCNQVLRGLISAKKIGDMTLDNLTQENAVYFQISCLTFDGEGNSFPNTLYPDTNSKKYPQYWQSWFNTVTPGMCNDAVALLWNKWFNQTLAPTALFSGNVLLRQPYWAQSYYAPAPRMHMPTTPFTLPPAISMTTPGLIKNMTVSDLGTPQFSSVDYIFHEIYDTSDSQPTYFLGAQTTAPTNLQLPKTVTITSGGANFDGIFGAANPSSSSSNPDIQAFLAYPEQYSAKYGTWDNVPGGMDGAFTTQAAITYIDDKSELTYGPLTIVDTNGNTVPLTGAATVYNTQQGNQFCTLMNTSEFTPWQNAGTTSWMLTYNGAVKADNTNHAFKDYYALPWALEGSRYDLYNGQWAAAAAAAGVIDYDAVLQGENNADGSLLWSDLSTGLKPRVANIIKSAWNGIPTTPAGAGASQAAQVTQLTAALAGQIWMLSCQAGPFVNAMGVRASRRDGTGVSAPADLLTFTYPGTAGSYSWPGWSGMKGQWWGVGTATNANVNVKAVLDQQNWGPADPTPAATIVSTGSTEDNFGVFSDYNIQFAAWVQMALDAQGIPASGSKRGAASEYGITRSVPVKYSTATDGTGVPKMGCYELAYLPMSWFGPS